MLKRRDVLAGIATLPLARSAFADDTAITKQSSWDALTQRGLYLPMLREPRGLKGGGIQLQAQFLALVGDEDAAFCTMARIDRPSAGTVDLTGARAESALAAIVRAAENRQIVILNEAHHISRCRAFALDVALALRALDFEVFTAEAFNNDGDPDVARALNAGGPITTDFGLYSDDPVYAELLRGARACGYRFAAYEARYDQLSKFNVDAQIASREQAEADNFVAHILDGNPRAHAFVYCGYTHVYKAPQANVRWFAARLKAKTGIDPLCITQAWGVPPPDPALEPEDLKAVLDRFNPTEPIVVSDASGNPIELGHAFDHGVDLSVFHPRVANVSGRPGWLAKAAGRKAMPYRLARPVPADGLLQAVPASEAKAANVVPSDQFPILEGTAEVTFFVPAGDYEIRLETDAGRQALGTLAT